MTEEEVNAKLEETNQKLFFNKLKIDLDKCYKNLMVVLNNIINAFQKDMELRVYEISFDAESLLSREDINIRIKEFFDRLRELSKKQIEDNINLLIESIDSQDMDKYTSELDIQVDQFVNEMGELYSKGIIPLIRSVSVEMDAYSKARMDKILKEIIYNHFIERIRAAVENTNSLIKNNISLNTVYLENMNKSTIKPV